MPGDPTPPQTVGPFFHPSLLGEPWTAVVDGSTSGERIRVEGRLLDGEGRPVSDGMIEIWQADPGGRYRHPADAGTPAPDEDFVGFGRSGTGPDGRFAFETVKPGSVAGPGESRQSPHLNVLVFARGLLDRLATRAYFDDDPSLETDPFLRSLPEERRTTLLARRQPDTSPTVYRYDVVLQGDAETVFFDG
jgi:protocatechuate 3,4-dioxygenase alpha subunit